MGRDMMYHTISPSVAASPHADSLDRITDPDVHFALWQRRRPASLDWIDALDWDAIDDVRLTIAMGDAPAALAAALTHAGYPPDAQGHALGEEIHTLVSHFARIMACERLTIRLEVIETDACRKFHADYVTARLLTTLHGAGTQWLHRDAPAEIWSMETGDVGLFKGRLWVEEPAILHRSPPLMASGGTRLLLVINPAPHPAA